MIVCVTDHCSPASAKQVHLCGGKKKHNRGPKEHISASAQGLVSSWLVAERAQVAKASWQTFDG